MVVIDTNVVSELMRSTPDAAVRSWIEGHSPTSLYTTSITEAEIYYGIELMPKGKRRDGIYAASGQMFATRFEGRILAFGSSAARHYAQITADRRRSGRPINQADALIAAIVLSERATLASRNVSDFEGCGIKIVNPWLSLPSKGRR